MRQTDIPMRVTYDHKQGYVYLTAPDESSASAHQVPLDENCGYEGRGEIILDFDKSWRLVGIDFGNANRSLPESILRKVKRA